MKRFYGLLAVMFSLALSYGAQAESLDQVISQAQPAEEEFLQSASVSDSELDKTRGTFDAETLGAAVLEATTVNNAVNGGVTGSNTVTEGSFGNAHGVVSLIQNSGNNVIIQNATVVNLTMQQ